MRTLGLAAALLVLLAGGLLVVFHKKLLAETLPEVEKIRFTHLSLTTDSARVQFLLKIRNKGVWNFRLKSVSIWIFDDTTQLLSYRNDSMRTLKPDETKVEQFDVVIPLKKLIRRIREHQPDDSASLAIKGILVFDTYAGDLKQVFRESISVKVPIPPRLTLEEIEYTGSDKGVHHFMLTAKLVNLNDRRFLMKDLRYEMTGEKLFDAYGFLPEVEIKALDSVDLHIPADVKLNDKLELFSRVVVKKEPLAYSFVLRGTISSVEGVSDEDVPAVFRTNGKLKLKEHDWRKNVRFVIRKKNRNHS